MAAAAVSVPDQIRQLDGARKLVLENVSYYKDVVRGTLPLIGANSAVEIRRWGADFLAEAFATPAVPNGEKETMQPYVLVTLESLLEDKNQDPYVLRSVIQTAASIYPLALRWIINNGYDTITWDKMMEIKQKILQIWERAPPTVSICCIKFAQRIILAQSHSSGAEHRHATSLDLSLDKIPPNHQSLDTRTLQAEATGLLDRMLTILQESNDALLVDAVLNSLCILIRTRPGTSSRIVTALLNFNPAQLASTSSSPRTRVMVRSMEKTTRILLTHLVRRDPQNPANPRIQQQIERNIRLFSEAFSDSKKRPLDAKGAESGDVTRQRIDVSTIQIPAFTAGSHSVADLFALIPPDGLRTFDVAQVPAPLVSKVSINALSKLDNDVFTRALEAVRDRLLSVANTPAGAVNPNTAPLGVDDDDDDYEPDFYEPEDAEQLLNKQDGSSSALEAIGLEDGLGLTSFSLPQPAQLTPEAALAAGNGTVSRVLDMLKDIDEPASKKLGFVRLAASAGNRDAWMTILTRLATRSSATLDEIKVKGEDEGLISQSLSNSIREILFNYVMEDFRKHIDVAVSWLCEEWYNDKLLSRLPGNRPAYYEKFALRLLDGFLPYLHSRDKVLTRFLSEIPELNSTMLVRVKQMCRDPSVVDLALKSLLYLVLMRPPAKEIALDTVQDIWTEYEDARSMAAKYLKKYRPNFLESATANTGGANDGMAITAA